MLITLSTASLMIYPLGYVFALAAEAGFDGVELAISPQVTLRGVAHVRQLSRSHELPVISVHPPLHRLPHWISQRDTFVRSVELANELSARVVTFHGPLVRSFEDHEARRWRQDMLLAKERCSPNLRIGMENHALFGPPPRVFPTVAVDPRHWDSFLEEHDLGITLDTAHVGSVGLDLLTVVRAIRPRLVNIHLSNVSDRRFPIRHPIAYSLVVQHQLPQRGLLPLADILASLADTGFPGPITLELSPLAVHFWDPREVRKLLTEAVRFCRQAAAIAR
ncbi:MAG: sugar phosphate isomerase/epimerase [Chloroflexota bacterium]|nr:MAG: sugar phosphate isomerase/epimerase [Chloroflexota bacterium]